jgi:hypothetical protein
VKALRRRDGGGSLRRAARGTPRHPGVARPSAPRGRLGGSVAQPELVALPGQLAPLGRHVSIEPPELGIMSRFRFYLAFVGSDAEFFRLRLRCHVRHPNNGRASKSDSS